MNILITSAGRRSYLIKYFKEAISNNGKVYASNSEYSVALKEADGYILTPLIYEENYIDCLISFCLKKNIKAIISVFDIDLLVLAKNKNLIESHGIKLLLSNEGIVEICNDKFRTYEFLKKNDIATTNTYIDLNKVKSEIEDGIIQFPLIIKPRWGMASMSIYIVENMDELEILYAKAIREVFNSYLKYESNLTKNNPLIIQEMLVGQEYGLDIINDLEGKFVGVFPKSKLRMRGGETDLGETVNQAKFEPLAKKLSTILKHEVIMSVDCFDVKGRIHVLEMNCRISGHYPLSHLAGVNLPKQIISWLNSESTNFNNFQFKTGLRITKELHPIVLDEL